MPKVEGRPDTLARFVGQLRQELLLSNDCPDADSTTATQEETLQWLVGVAVLVRALDIALSTNLSRVSPRDECGID